MEENFKEEHENSGVTDPLMKGGYPDAGSGRYTMKAGYKAWYEFNSAQRVHMQYMESITQILCMQLFAGLQWPIPTMVIGVVYLIGRILYTYGYMSGGPKGRIIGVPLIMLVQMFMPIYTIVAMAMLAQQEKITLSVSIQ